MEVPCIMISGGLQYGGLTRSLLNAFEVLGWNARGFDDYQVLLDRNRWARKAHAFRLLWRQFARPVQSEFLLMVERLKPTIILVLKGFCLSPEAIARARQLSPRSMLVHFNPDNSFNTWHFGNSNAWVRASIPLYDVHLTWGKFLIPQLTARGARKVAYLPFACDPAFHHPVPLGNDDMTVFGADVSVVGSWDKEREWWLSHLEDYRLGIWGNAWDKAAAGVRKKWLGRPAFGDDFAKVCLASKVNLNLIRRQNLPAHNMRTFEIPACGGFMLATRTAEQCEILGEGREIACFSDPLEMRRSIDMYLADDQSRAAMSARSLETVSRGHSYAERARKIVELLADWDSTGRQAS